MFKSKLTLIEIAALVIAAAITVYLMLRSAAWVVDGGTLAFLAWAVSPYLIFYLAGRLFRKFLPIPHLAVITFVIALLMLAFSATVYFSVIWGSSSTEALIFLVVPVYLYIGSIFLLTLGTAIAWFTRKK